MQWWHESVFAASQIQHESGHPLSCMWSTGSDFRGITIQMRRQPSDVSPLFFDYNPPLPSSLPWNSAACQLHESWNSMQTWLPADRLCRFPLPSLRDSCEWSRCEWERKREREVKAKSRGTWLCILICPSFWFLSSSCFMLQGSSSEWNHWRGGRLLLWTHTSGRAYSLPEQTARNPARNVQGTQEPENFVSPTKRVLSCQRCFLAFFFSCTYWAFFLLFYFPNLLLQSFFLLTDYWTPTTSPALIGTHLQDYPT